MFDTICTTFVQCWLQQMNKLNSNENFKYILTIVFCSTNRRVCIPVVTTSYK